MKGTTSKRFSTLVKRGKLKGVVLEGFGCQFPNKKDTIDFRPSLIHSNNLLTDILMAVDKVVSDLHVRENGRSILSTTNTLTASTNRIPTSVFVMLEFQKQS